MPLIQKNKKSLYISIEKLKILKLKKWGVFGWVPHNISVHTDGHLYEYCENGPFTKINASETRHPTLP